MKKLSALLLLCTKILIPASTPHFASPINLISPRNLAERLEKKYPDQIPAAVLTWLQTSNSYLQLQDCIGRQLTQNGHDTERKEIYTGTKREPSYIVLTKSGTPTLKETADALATEGLAHPFIIDTNGEIHPVTQEGEAIEQALLHRFYALGISGRVVDGCYEQRDMNSTSISISIVGKQNEELTSKQIEAVSELIQYLQAQYQIRPDQVLDYGCVACFADGKYGRRNANAFLPWKQLQEQGLATYPDQKIVEDTIINFKTEAERTIWTSQALRKIGYICPNTNNLENEHFKAAIATFALHTAIDLKDPEYKKKIIGNLNSMLMQHEQQNPKLKEIQPPALPLRSEEVSICREFKNIF